jgi:hypothetical protein
VRLRTALAIAQRRPGVLEQLPEPLYQEGVARLTAAIAQRGPEAELNSELTLVVVQACKESS